MLPHGNRTAVRSPIRAQPQGMVGGVPPARPFAGGLSLGADVHRLIRADFLQPARRAEPMAKVGPHGLGLPRPKHPS